MSDVVQDEYDDNFYYGNEADLDFELEDNDFMDEYYFCDDVFNVW